MEIYPGFPAHELLFGEKGDVTGVVTGDLGVARDSHHKENLHAGVNILGKYTLLAEGARGSLAKIALARYGLGQVAAIRRNLALVSSELWELKGKHQLGLGGTWHGLAARQWHPVGPIRLSLGRQFLLGRVLSYTSITPIPIFPRSTSSSAPKLIPLSR